MRKFLTASLLLTVFALSATFASAQNGRYNPQQQDRYYGNNQQNNRNWRNNRRARTVTQTRIVRQGRRTYRETVQVTYLRNGRTQTRVINRVRIDR